jgi:hypothetical protein
VELIFGNGFDPKEVDRRASDGGWLAERETTGGAGRVLLASTA